jgi:hypothetical protein
MTKNNNNERWLAPSRVRCVCVRVAAIAVAAIAVAAIAVAAVAVASALCVRAHSAGPAQARPPRGRALPWVCVGIVTISLSYRGGIVTIVVYRDRGAALPWVGVGIVAIVAPTHPPTAHRRPPSSLASPSSLGLW